MMNRDDIIRVMRELLGPESENWEVDEALLQEWMPFFQALVAAEREACADLCKYVYEEVLDDREGIAKLCEGYIRARGTPPCPDCHGIGYDASGQTCGCQP